MPADRGSPGRPLRNQSECREKEPRLEVVGVSPLVHGVIQPHHLPARSGVVRAAGREQTLETAPPAGPAERVSTNGTVAVGVGPEGEESLGSFSRVSDGFRGGWEIRRGGVLRWI